MEFSLYYRGPLKPNGDVQHKHDLRRHFHKQLGQLWAQAPLSECGDLLKKPPQGSTSILVSRGSFEFAPLVSPSLNLHAELDIVFLRPEPAGAILAQGGDIDNRLKTLFDALAVPQHLNQIPAGASPEVDENPFYCVLADDKLVTRVSLKAEQLLEPGIHDPQVVAIVRVTTKATRASWANVGLA